ncbi:hypothetical protein AAMO2058_000899900 [Amorphochlora amoebiformis]
MPGCVHVSHMSALDSKKDASNSPVVTWKIPHVRVGVGTLVFKRDKDGKHLVLIGKRKGSHGEGKYALPGGHLELGESWGACGSRELEEETNIRIESKSWRIAFVSNDVMPKDRKHYITIFLQVLLPDENPQEAKNMEPNKCEKWEWRLFQDLKDTLKPDSLFIPLKHLVFHSDFVPMQTSTKNGAHMVFSG